MPRRNSTVALVGAHVRFVACAAIPAIRRSFEVGRRPSQGSVLAAATVGIEHRPFQSSGRALPRCGGPVARSGRTSPHSNEGRSCVSHPSPTAPFGCMGDRRRGRSVENARPLSLSSGSGRRPGRVSSDIVRSRPRATQKPAPPLDQWHGADGVIHALSTATIPRQSSRGGQRVGNPLDELGRWPFRAFATPPAPEHRPFHSRRKGRRKSSSGRRPSPLGRPRRRLVQLSPLRPRCRSPTKPRCRGRRVGKSGRDAGRSSSCRGFVATRNKSQVRPCWGLFGFGE